MCKKEKYEKFVFNKVVIKREQLIKSDGTKVMKTTVEESIELKGKKTMEALSTVSSKNSVPYEMTSQINPKSTPQTPSPTLGRQNAEGTNSETENKIVVKAKVKRKVLVRRNKSPILSTSLPISNIIRDYSDLKPKRK